MNIDFQFINQILVVLINLIGIWLVFWVCSADKKGTLNKGFILLLIPNLLWIDFYNFASLIDQNYLSLLFIKLTFAFTFIFFIRSYYFFIIWF